MAPCLSRPLQSNLTWGILPFVLALTLITMAMAPLWRYRARSLMDASTYIADCGMTRPVTATLWAADRVRHPPLGCARCSIVEYSRYNASVAKRVQLTCR